MPPRRGRTHLPIVRGTLALRARTGRRGRLVVLEGPDKSGKSTQAALLVRALRARRLPVVHTREPGGTSFAESIRRILLEPKNDVHPMAELLLYEAARAQHTNERLLPALRAGKVIICERYALATLAYQGYGRGLPLPLIRELNRAATAGLRPDLTIVLDIPEAGFARARRRHDRLERESRRFRRKVREGYRALARREPRVVLLNGSAPIARLHDEIVDLVVALLKR